MKRLFLFLLCLGTLALTSCEKDDSEPPKESGPAFPDARFRAFLVEIGFEETDRDINPNTEKNKARLAVITKLSIENMDILSLKGIEYFEALTVLRCSSNQISTLDLSKNTKLTELWCTNNPLTTLNVSKNTALTELECNNNRLTNLDLPQSTTLTKLWCYKNRLLALDLSKNTALLEIKCYDNQIAKLDLSKNRELRQLQCSKNQLSELNLSKNIKLDLLQCYNNQLSTLDVSMLSQLSDIGFLCGDQLPDKELTLRLTSVQNSKLTYFDQRAENARVKKVIID